MENNLKSCQQDDLFGNSCGTPLDKKSIRCNLIPALETLFDSKRWTDATAIFLAVSFRSLSCMHKFKFFAVLFAYYPENDPLFLFSFPVFAPSTHSPIPS